jgi:hypothetical protein
VKNEKNNAYQNKKIYLNIEKIPRNKIFCMKINLSHKRNAAIKLIFDFYSKEIRNKSSAVVRVIWKLAQHV